MRLDNYQKVIVHGGFPKTGSSYIQNLYHDNRDILARHGIDYPQVVTARNYVRRRGNHTVAVKDYVEDDDVWGHISDRLCFRRDCRTLLLSAEGFPNAIRLAGFLRGFLALVAHAEVRFIFYIRRFDHLIESLYSQLVKGRVYGDISGLRHQMDFGRRIARLAGSVGKENIVIRPYNRKLWPHGELAADLCSAMGAPELWSEMQPDEPMAVNVSLPRPQVFLLSRLRSPQAKGRLLRWLLKNPDAIPPDGSKFFRSPEERRRFNDCYRPAAQRFADEYCLGDIGEFLDLDFYDDDRQWAPFVPDWDMFMRCLPGSASFLPELQAAANRDTATAAIGEPA